MPTRIVSTLASASVLVAGAIHGSPSMRLAKAALIPPTILSIAVFDEAGKYLATYNCPIASPSWPLTAPCNCLERDCSVGVPFRIVPKKAKSSACIAVGRTGPDWMIW